MNLSTLTSKHSKCESQFRTSTSTQQTFKDSTVAERIEMYLIKRCLQFTSNLRPAYIAGFNQAMSDATIAPIPSEFAGGNEKTRAYCCGANDASLCLPICSNDRLFNKSLMSVC